MPVWEAPLPPLGLPEEEAVTESLPVAEAESEESVAVALPDEEPPLEVMVRTI